MKRATVIMRINTAMMTDAGYNSSSIATSSSSLVIGGWSSIVVEAEVEVSTEEVVGKVPGHT